MDRPDRFAQRKDLQGVGKARRSNLRPQTKEEKETPPPNSLEGRSRDLELFPANGRTCLLGMKQYRVSWAGSRPSARRSRQAWRSRTKTAGSRPGLRE